MHNAQWEIVLVVGSLKKWAFQQLFYHLEKPYFVNISVKTPWIFIRYSGHTLLLCMTFVLIIRTSKHFWLLQCIWHLTRVTYPWFITNCSHWNHCIWSQELWEHKFLDLKKVLLFYRSMLRLSFQRSCDHIQWFQWLQVVVHHRYVTLIRCHMHWCSQKCLEVLIISTAMSCTKAVCGHCMKIVNL